MDSYKKEAWNCNATSLLKVVGNLMSRCSNSSPRYSVRNHYAIFACLKSSYVFDYKISITLLYFQICPVKGDSPFIFCKGNQLFELSASFAPFYMDYPTTLSFQKFAKDAYFFIHNRNFCANIAKFRFWTKLLVVDIAALYA